VAKLLTVRLWWRLAGIDRADIPIYRYQEVLDAIAKYQIIFIVEGETVADLLWSLSLPATCNIGGSGKWRLSDSQDLAGAQTAISPDRDVPGLKHAELIYKDFPSAQWLYPYPESSAWDNLPKSQGLDIADWVSSKNLSAQDILKSLTPHPRTYKDVVRLESNSSISDYIPDTAPTPELNYVQKAVEALYSDSHWVSIAGQLFEFTGTHYELRPEATEKRRALDWLSTYSEFVKGKYSGSRCYEVQ